MEKRNKKVLTPEELASQKTTADAVEERLAAEKEAEEEAASAAAKQAEELPEGEQALAEAAPEEAEPVPGAEEPGEPDDAPAAKKSGETWKYMLKLGGILCVLTFSVSLILAVVNELTKDRIAEIAAERLAISMQTVAPDAVSFEKAEFDSNLYTSVGSVYTALDADGAPCGYVVNVFPAGYGGEIDLVVGVSTEGAVTGVTVNSHSETPGLGALITESYFLEQFTDHTAGIVVVKSNASGNDINALTGATKSSAAVTTGVNTAIELAVAMQ